MPHLTLEYTGNLAELDVRRTLVSLNTALMESGHFEGRDIKCRAFRLSDYLVGDSFGAGAFAHVTLRLLSGRSTEVKADLARRLLGALTDSARRNGATAVQLTVEVYDLERLSYAKAIA